MIDKPKKSIFDLVEREEIKKPSPIVESLREASELLYEVLNETLLDCYFVNPIEQMTRGFDKRSLAQLNEVSTSLFGCKKVIRTVKYERGQRTFQPLTEHKEEAYWRTFWIDIIECPEELKELNEQDARLQFDRRMMNIEMVQQKRQFMENKGHIYIIHYDYHHIFDIIKNSN